MAVRRGIWFGRAAGIFLALSGCAAGLPVAEVSGAADAALAVSALHEPRFLPDSEPRLDVADTGVTTTIRDAGQSPERGCHIVPGGVLRLEPAADGLRIVGLDLPEVISPADSDAGTAGALHLADYSLAGEWSRSAGRLLSIDEAVTGLRVGDGPGRLTIGSIRSSIRVSRAPDGSWQEGGTLDVRDFRRSWPASQGFSRLWMRWTAPNIEPTTLLELAMWDNCNGGTARIPYSYRRSLRHVGVTTPFEAEMHIEGFIVTGDYVPTTVKLPDASFAVAAMVGTRTPARWELRFADDSGRPVKVARAVLHELDGLLYHLAGFAPAQLSFQFPDLGGLQGEVASLPGLGLSGGETANARHVEFRRGSDGGLTVKQSPVSEN